VRPSHQPSQIEPARYDAELRWRRTEVGQIATGRGGTRTAVSARLVTLRERSAPPTPPAAPPATPSSYALNAARAAGRPTISRW